MGEKKEGGKGDGGEKKKKNNKEDVGEGIKKVQGSEKKKDDGGEKKDDRPITVVLKVDMHCEGCARKMKHSVKGFEGVEAVDVDCANGKLTVVGKVDPWKLRDRVESKTRKQVVLVSPINLPKKVAVVKEEMKVEQKKKPDEKKLEEPTASTVVLKIRLHCEGCSQRIRKTISKIKGVEAVSVDTKEELVTVKGTMDAKTLPDYLNRRLKRTVEIVPAKNDKGGGGGGGKKEKSDKKDGGAGGADENKGKERGSGAGEVAEKKRDGEGGPKVAVVPEANRMEHYGYGAFGGYPPYGYRLEMLRAPQLFSDENPNACSIM